MRAQCKGAPIDQRTFIYHAGTKIALNSKRVQGRVLVHRARAGHLFLDHSPPVPLFAPPHQTTRPILVNLLWQLCHIMWVCLEMMHAFATVLGLTFVKRTPWSRDVVIQLQGVRCCLLEGLPEVRINLGLECTAKEDPIEGEVPAGFAPVTIPGIQCYTNGKQAEGKTWYGDGSKLAQEVGERTVYTAGGAMTCGPLQVITQVTGPQTLYCPEFQSFAVNTSLASAN